MSVASNFTTMWLCDRLLSSSREAGGYSPEPKKPKKPKKPKRRWWQKKVSE